MKMTKKILSLLYILPASLLSAQSFISSQSHSGKVTSLISTQTATSQNNDFFSAGTDGFLVKWNENSSGEHYQISDLSINLSAKNPLNNEIAIYETDSLTMNRITVIDWTNFNKKFSKRFKDTITCLSYSEKGSYLIVGTTAVNGIYILNGKTGIVNKNIKEISGIITMAKTGSTEKTAVMYSPSGFLYYYDFTKGKVIAKFQTQTDLEQTILFGTGNLQNRFFAGIKNNVIYIIDALSGKIITQTPASSPLIVTGNNSDDEGLYYTTSSGKGYSLKLISYDSLEENLKKKASYNVQEGILVKNFMGLRSRDSFTAIAKNQDRIYLGTSFGDIYNMSDIAESETYSLQPITEKMFKKIYDITSDKDAFYFLTEDSIYMSDYDSKQPVKLAANPYQTNFIVTKSEDSLINSNGLILWSKDTRKDVVIVKNDIYSGDSTYEKLFTPKAKLNNVRLFDSKVLFIQGNNTVSIFDLETQNTQEIYNGTSLEDAVLVQDTVYIAKSALSSNDSSLIAVNINTGETVPLKTNGNVVFSLSYNENDPSSIYGLLMANQKDALHTTVFSYNTNLKLIKSLISINDEDPSAFTSMNGYNLFTNIGKNQVYSFDTRTTRNISYKRASSIPVKIAVSNRYASILNRDGSISWYNINSQAAISNWYLTTENTWWEF